MNNFLYAAELFYTSHYTVHFEVVVIIYRKVVLCENVISLWLDVKLVQRVCNVYAFRKTPPQHTQAHTAVQNCVMEKAHIRLSLPATPHIEMLQMCFSLTVCSQSHTHTQTRLHTFSMM